MLTFPQPGRLKAYLAERYPQGVALVMSLSLGLASWVLAQAGTLSAEARVLLDEGALVACVLVYLFMFLLRVFDEHKDYEADAAAQPDRPVQRGLVTLAELRSLGILAVVLQLALASLHGWRGAVVYLAPLLYSLLMYVEFFAPEWLRARLFAYAVSHMVVMPLLALALALRFLVPRELPVPVEVWLFLPMVFTSFLSLEVLRKIRAPESERPGVDTYSGRMGPAAACVLGAALILTSGLLAGVIGWRLDAGLAWTGVIAAATVYGVAQPLKFASRPTPPAEKALLGGAALHLLASFLGLTIALLLRWGIRF